MLTFYINLNYVLLEHDIFFNLNFVDYISNINHNLRGIICNPSNREGLMIYSICRSRSTTLTTNSSYIQTKLIIKLQIDY